MIDASNARAVTALLDRSPARDPAIARRVARIVSDVRQRGDRALLAYARRFDGLDGDVEVSRDEMLRAAATVPADVRRAIHAAARHIRHVAERQVPRGWITRPAPGVSIEQRVTPLDRVACYVPGGRYPLPSSLLMTVIPARVAGVRDVIAVCPRPDATVMLAALEGHGMHGSHGIHGTHGHGMHGHGMQGMHGIRLFRLGGAHAIAALAYGTATIPRVDKIVGPGNAYVAAAKALVSADCGIEFFAGPSEILIVSASGRPAWIAADLIAQAEHDEHARAVLVTPRRSLARAVAREIARQMPPAGPARRALRRHGAIVVTRTLDEAIAFSERMAPEHVVCDSPAIAARLRRAGTVFVGRHSAQAAGDYVTGSNHVLPTSGAAAARGGLSAADFVRVTTVQHLSRAGLRGIGPHAIALARAEGLQGHAESIRIRWQARAGGNRREAAARARSEVGNVKGPHRAE